MSENDSLILKPGCKYNFPEFNSKIKYSTNMENVLYTLFAFHILSGKINFSNVVEDLIAIHKLTPKTTGDTLKELNRLGVINYYKEGRGRTIKLDLDNTFLKSAYIRFFGITSFSNIECEKLPQILVGFHPLGDVEKISRLYREETQHMDLLLDEEQYIFDWLDSISKLERIAKTTLSVDEPVDGNPLLTFIDSIISGLNFQQSIQSQTLSFDQIEEIVTNVVSESAQIPPWIDHNTKYHPMADIEEEYK